MKELLERQAARLAGTRSRVFRRIGIAQRGPVLDLGAGYGSVTRDLVRRCRGPVVALDTDAARLKAVDGSTRVTGDARQLPFHDDTFELVFSQNILMWTGLDGVVEEVCRVLKPDGSWVAVEPDFAAMIEYPDVGLRESWMSSVPVPDVGRRLAPAFREAGLEAAIALLDQPADVDADFPSRGAQFVHVPYFFVTGTARSPNTG